LKFHILPNIPSGFKYFDYQSSTPGYHPISSKNAVIFENFIEILKDKGHAGRCVGHVLDGGSADERSESRY